MISAAATLIFVAAGVCATASLIDTATRIPRILARLEAERPNN